MAQIFESKVSKIIQKDKKTLLLNFFPLLHSGIKINDYFNYGNDKHESIELSGESLSAFFDRKHVETKLNCKNKNSYNSGEQYHKIDAQLELVRGF